LTQKSMKPAGVPIARKMSSRVSIKKLRESGVNSSLGGASEFNDYSTLGKADIGNDRYLRGGKKSHSVMQTLNNQVNSDKITLYRNENERETMIQELGKEQANYSRLLAKQRKDGGPGLGVAKMPLLAKGVELKKGLSSSSVYAKKNMSYYSQSIPTKTGSPQR